MMFGAPATAAPLPEQVRTSPMHEAPPPAFSPLNRESQLESPPVEPLHRVMSSNPNYVAGINQEGPSPIVSNLSGGSGYGNRPSSPPPSSTNLGYLGGNQGYPSGNAGYPSGTPGYSSGNLGNPSNNTSYPGGQRYSGMPEFAPAPPPPAYPPAHASPLAQADHALGADRPGILPPPIFSAGGSTPLSALGGAAPLINASAGPSEYTQLISSGPPPVVPELKPTAKQLGAAGTVKPKRRLPTGLIIVANAVLLIATFLMFFVLRKQVPNRASLTPHIAKPVLPNAPQIPR